MSDFVILEEAPDDGGCDGYFGCPHFKKDINVWTSPGGKVKLAKTILPMLSPSHNTYTEVFAGSAAIFMRKPRVDFEVLNDLDEEIAKAYATIQTMTDEDIALIGKMSWTGDRGTFNKLYAMDPRTMGKQERLYRWLYLNRFSFGNMVVSGFMPRSQGVSSNSWQRLTRARDRLKGVSIYCGDYADPLLKHDGVETLHYIDPPYPGHNARLKEAQLDEGRFHETLEKLQGKFLITYGIKGEWPMMIRRKPERYRVKRIYPRRAFGPTGNMGSATRLGQLIVTNYEVTQKGFRHFDDANFAVEDWNDATERLYEAINSGGLYSKIDFHPTVDMAAVSAAALKKNGEVASELAEKITKRRELDPNEVTLLLNWYASEATEETKMALGGDAGVQWVQKTFRKMVEAEQSMGRRFHQVGALKVPDAPIVIQQDCVVLSDAGEAIYISQSDSLGELLEKNLPIPGGMIRNVLMDGHNAIAHRPLYHLALIPADDFAHRREVKKYLGEFDYEQGNTGSVSIQAWGKKDEEPTSVKLMFHREGMNADDHWQGGTLATSPDEFREDQIAKMVIQAIRVQGAPGCDDRIARGDMRFYNTFQREDVEAVQVGGHVGKQIELAKWVAGRQEPDYREFFFDGDLLNGRFVFIRLPEETQIEKAIWSTAFVNDLPDSAFLWIEPGGKKDEDGKTKPRSLRHFPYKDDTGKIDLPHLRNAIARIPQLRSPDFSSEMADRLQAKARRLLEDQTKKSASSSEAWLFTRFEDDEQFACEPVAKRADAGMDFVILRKDVEKRIVLGPVLIPETTDLQGDIIDADAIEQAAHNYLAGINKNRGQGVMHNDFSRQIEVVECYVAPVDFELNGRKVIKGTWMLASRILDDETWEKVKKGELRGFSIGGIARDTQKVD